LLQALDCVSADRATASLHCMPLLVLFYWLATAHNALDAGHPAAAAVAYKNVVRILATAHCPAPNLLHARISLASALLESGELREAEMVLRETGPQPDSVELENAWGVLYLRQGRLRTAESRFLQAASLGAPGEHLAAVYHNLAAIEMRTGRYAGALVHARQAVAWWEQSLGPERRELIRGWASLATSAYLTGDLPAAEQAARRAVVLTRKNHGPSHPLLADLLEAHAITLERLRRKREAKEERREAAHIRKWMLQAPPPDAIDAREAATVPKGLGLKHW
jgi:tetratricopeptide (TPR) repeat protein